MQDDLTGAFRALLDGKVVLPARVEELQAAYRDARPFPHVVLPGLFDPKVLDALLAEMADMRRDQWKQVDNDSRERTSRMKSPVASP